MLEDQDLNPEVPVARRSRVDLVFGLAAVLGAALFMLWAIPMGVSVPASVEAAPLSPAFLPYVLSALIGMMGVVCILQATLGQGVPKEEGELTFTAHGHWPLRLVLILAVFGAVYLLPDIVGMLPLAILVMGALVFAGGERNLRRGLLLSVLLPLGIWLFFTRVAQVPLPEGLIEGYIPL